MANYQLLILLFTAVASHANYTDVIGSRCSRQAYDVDACLQRKFNSVLAYIKNGAPDLGFAKSESLVIDDLRITLDDEYVTFKDIHASGDITITNLKSDLESHQFQITLFGSHISAHGRFLSSFKVLWEKIGGDCWGNYDGVTIVVNFRGKPYEHWGNTYLKIQHLDMDFTFNNMQMGVKNLRNNDLILQSFINTVLKLEAKNVVEKIKPELKRRLGDSISHFVQRILQRIPYDMWIEE